MLWRRGEGRVQGIEEEKRNLHTWKGFKMLLGNSVEWESGWGSRFLHARSDELDMHRFPPNIEQHKWRAGSMSAGPPVADITDTLYSYRWNSPGRPAFIHPSVNHFCLGFQILFVCIGIILCVKLHSSASKSPFFPTYQTCTSHLLFVSVFCGW